MDGQIVRFWGSKQPPAPRRQDVMSTPTISKFAFLSYGSLRRSSLLRVPDQPPRGPAWNSPVLAGKISAGRPLWGRGLGPGVSGGSSNPRAS